MCVLSHQLLTITHFKNNLKPHVQTETRSNICMMQTGAMWPVIGTNNCILEKTVQWKQGLKPSCNGNINTMINMQLKVSTYAAPARKNTQTNSISISLFLENFSRPLLGSSLPFSNFSTASPPPFLGIFGKANPPFKRGGRGGLELCLVMMLMLLSTFRVIILLICCSNWHLGKKTNLPTCSTWLVK